MTTTLRYDEVFSDADGWALAGVAERRGVWVWVALRPTHFGRFGDYEAVALGRGGVRHAVDAFRATVEGDRGYRAWLHRRLGARPRIDSAALEMRMALRLRGRCS